MSPNRRQRIVVLGSGLAGLYTALQLEKTLARDPNVEVTLVNRENFFLFTPMLHEVAASDLDLAQRAGATAKRPAAKSEPGGQVDDEDFWRHGNGRKGEYYGRSVQFRSKDLITPPAIQPGAGADLDRDLEIC
ncbi:MAG: FAD-dependent oxidoreductase [Deinococcus sp.]|nr:FAD-dependent oxidoreductase [Deinococcus sp.]